MQELVLFMCQLSDKLSGTWHGWSEAGWASVLIESTTVISLIAVDVLPVTRVPRLPSSPLTATVASSELNPARPWTMRPHQHIFWQWSQRWEVVVVFLLLQTCLNTLTPKIHTVYIQAFIFCFFHIEMIKYLKFDGKIQIRSILEINYFWSGAFRDSFRYYLF